MIKKTFILLILPTVLLFSCKKEKTTWDTDWEAPLVHGELTINDMIPVDYTATNTEGYLSLVIHESVFEFSLDTLIKLPDTTVNEKTAITIPSIEVTPSFIQPSTYDQEMSLGEIKLKRVIIGSGEIFTEMTSVWPGKTKLILVLPNVIGPTGSFGHVYYMDAGSIDDPKTDSKTFDMADYDMDLTGIDENSFNSIGINVIVQSGEETDSYIVTSADTNIISFTFKDMIPKYAMGYFGQYTFSDTMDLKIPQMKKIVAGTIDLDSIDLNITVKNGFNLLAQSKISKVTGLNTRTSNIVDLDFVEKNSTMNIDPASGGLYDYVPSEYPIEMNNTNSNLLEFLENLSDEISVGYELKINPFGNITAGSDEFFPDSKMELFLDGEFPMNIGADDLTIQDTLNIDWNEISTANPEEALIFLEYTNGFPIGAESKFYLLDGNDNVIDSIVGNAPILTGDYAEETFVTTPSTGTIQFEVSAETLDNLESAKRMVLRVAFNSYSSEKVKLPVDAFFNFNLRSNLQIRVSL